MYMDKPRPRSIESKISQPEKITDNFESLDSERFHHFSINFDELSRVVLPSNSAEASRRHIEQLICNTFLAATDIDESECYDLAEGISHLSYKENRTRGQMDCLEHFSAVLIAHPQNRLTVEQRTLMLNDIACTSEAHAQYTGQFLDPHFRHQEVYKRTVLADRIIKDGLNTLVAKARQNPELVPQVHRTIKALENAECLDVTQQNNFKILLVTLNVKNR